MPEVAADVEMALGTGYGESKWICEEILAISRAETDLQPVIVRIGQVSGGVNGYWKPSEWIPSIVQSAALTGCLPSLDKVSKSPEMLMRRANRTCIQDIHLLPAEIAAAAIVNLRSSTKEYLHLSHPRPTPWNVVMRYTAQKFGVPLVPWAEWLDRLGKSEPSMSENENAALRLLGFYKAAKVDADHRDAGGVARYDLSIAMSETAVLDPGNLSSIGPDDVQKWLDFWKSIGCISY